MAWWGSELTAGFIPSPTSREKSFKVFQTPCLGKLGLRGLIGQWQENLLIRASPGSCHPDATMSANCTNLVIPSQENGAFLTGMPVLGDAAEWRRTPPMTRWALPGLFSD